MITIVQTNCKVFKTNDQQCKTVQNHNTCYKIKIQMQRHQIQKENKNISRRNSGCPVLTAVQFLTHNT